MKQLIHGNQQCSETIEELQKRVEVAAVSRTPRIFLRIRQNMLRHTKAYIASQGQHFQRLKR